MAATTNRLCRSLLSSSALFNCSRRSISTTASVVTETDVRLKSPNYPHSPLPHQLDPKGRNVQWVFLGVPGVGKGTYASRLCSLLGVPHIATGDLVREELATTSPLSAQVYPSVRFFTSIFVFVCLYRRPLSSR